MTRCSVQTRKRIFVKRYGFFSFARNMSKNIGKNISKNLSGKYCKKSLDHAKQSTTDALKTSSKGVIQKKAKATADLIGNKIAYKITKVSRNPQQNNSEVVINEHDKEIPQEKYISLEEKQQIIEELRII